MNDLPCYFDTRMPADAKSAPNCVRIAERFARSISDERLVFLGETHLRRTKVKNVKRASRLAP
jgi:hypothetical protein